MVSRYESKMAIAVKWHGVCDITQILNRHFAPKWETQKIKNNSSYCIELFYWTHDYKHQKKKKKNYLTKCGGLQSFCTHLWAPSKWTAASSETQKFSESDTSSPVLEIPCLDC